MKLKEALTEVANDKKETARKEKEAMDIIREAFQDAKALLVGERVKVGSYSIAFGKDNHHYIVEVGYDVVKHRYNTVDTIGNSLLCTSSDGVVKLIARVILDLYPEVGKDEV